jgi:hypothetical protein
MASERAQRALAYALGLGVPCLVVSPLLTGAADSFPVSTYPMFAQPRGQPTLHTMVALGPSGEQRLSPPLIGTKEVLQSKVLIQRSVAGGEGSMAELCSSAAARVAQAPGYEAAHSVAIVARRYDPVSYFVSGPTPLDEQRLFACPVPAHDAPGATP